MEKNKKIVLTSVTLATAAAACAGIIFCLNNVVSTENTVPTVSVADIIVEESVEKTVLPDEWWTLYDYVPSPTGMTEKAKSLLHLNEDIGGWITIDGTDVDYPILFDHKCPEDVNPEEWVTNSYYLDKGLDGEYDRAGSLFMDYRNVFGYDEESQSDNIVIYGHNMANDTMFGSLRKYRQDYTFYDENPVIWLSSNYTDYQYVIFGFMITSGNWYTDFRYWDMEDFATEDDFNYYVDTVKQNSLVDTGVDVQYGDKLLTLSTCYADADNSRFIVVARRLREHETSMDNIDRTEAYIEEQKQKAETATTEER